MNTTYDDILETMETEFLSECGEYAENYPETELRFRAVASEIYAAFTAADYALRQAFVQTAEGEYLDKHAEIRGIERKKASYAKGTLIFSVPQLLENDVNIPKGTICSVKGEPLIQFSTDESAVITAGNYTVQVAATSLAQGDRFNAAPGSIRVMVNPPEYVIDVTNGEAFSQGSDEETDEALRSRIMDSYSGISNGVNAKTLTEIALTIDTIKDALYAMDPENGVYTLWIRTENGVYPNKSVMSQIYDKLGIIELCGSSYAVTLADERDFSVYAAVKVMSGADKEKIAAEVEERIRSVCSEQRIGRQIAVSTIASEVSSVENVRIAEVSAQPSYEGVITCGTGEYLVLSDVQVDIYE